MLRRHALRAAAGGVALVLALAAFVEAAAGHAQAQGPGQGSSLLQGTAAAQRLTPAQTLTPAQGAPASAQTLTPAQAQLLASAVPKTVVVSAATGRVLSVSATAPTFALPGLDTAPGAPVDPSPGVSGGTDCTPEDGCYYTPDVSGIYHDRSFYGSPGTFTGYWPDRNAWDSGSYSAYACWESACSQWVGPYTYVTFGGALVTGTSFTIN